MFSFLLNNNLCNVKYYYHFKAGLAHGQKNLTSSKALTYNANDKENLNTDNKFEYQHTTFQTISPNITIRSPLSVIAPGTLFLIPLDVPIFIFISNQLLIKKILHT